MQQYPEYLLWNRRKILTGSPDPTRAYGKQTLHSPIYLGKCRHDICPFRFTSNVTPLLVCFDQHSDQLLSSHVQICDAHTESRLMSLIDLSIFNFFSTLINTKMLMIFKIFKKRPYWLIYVVVPRKAHVQTNFRVLQIG